MEILEKREFSDEKRKELAGKGHAMKDGSFPIENVTDLHNAIQSIGRSKNYAKTKSHIIQRAKDLGATSVLPDDWKITKFINDIKDAFEKAIGTTSSANQEADERSVENYVRGNYNTNTNNQTGGNIMSNTTEPDPQGDIAVNKSFPTAGGDQLISQETRPTDGATSVSDAPNNPGVVPDQATFESSATAAIAPSKTDEVSTPDKVTIAKGEKCPTCGSIAKGDDADEDDKVEKSANCSDCGKEMSLCNCMGKSVDEAESKEEAAKETPADEKAEMKKSLWGGAFAPFRK
jgi:hypothetical protein